MPKVHKHRCNNDLHGMIKKNSPRVDAGFSLRLLYFPAPFGRECFLTFLCRSLLSVAEKTKVCRPSLIPSLVSSSPSSLEIPSNSVGIWSFLVSISEAYKQLELGRHELRFSKREPQDILQLCKMASFDHSICFVEYQESKVFDFYR